MRDRGARKREKKDSDATVGCQPAEKLPETAAPTIPVCLGDFGIGEAEAFRPLWEATWSQDVRGKSTKK